MWFKILVPINGTPEMFLSFWSLEAGKITWYKIVAPVTVFAIVLLIFLVIQFVLQVAFKFFKKARRAK